MIQRRTQTAEYWQEQFALVKKDEAFLYDQILDGGKPVSTAVLAEALIGRHCRQEEDLIEAELSKGEVYQPKDGYEVGAPIIFPVFEYALATVSGTRPGTSPEYGDFTVIQVEFEGDDEVREFASGLQGEHRLNRTEGEAEILVSADDPGGIAPVWPTVDNLVIGAGIPEPSTLAISLLIGLGLSAVGMRKRTG